MAGPLSQCSHICCYYTACKIKPLIFLTPKPHPFAHLVPATLTSSLFLKRLSKLLLKDLYTSSSLGLKASSTSQKSHLIRVYSQSPPPPRCYPLLLHLKYRYPPTPSSSQPPLPFFKAHYTQHLSAFFSHYNLGT